MSTYGVSKFLFAFNRDPRVRSAFGADPAETLKAYPVDEIEREAILTFNFRTLYDRGVHPLLLTALANGSGLPILTYFEALRTGTPARPHGGTATSAASKEASK